MTDYATRHKVYKSGLREWARMVNMSGRLSGSQDPATPQLMQQHAHSIVQQMRAAGLQEVLIALMKRHLTQLQQSQQQRAQFRKELNGQGMPQQPQQPNSSILIAPQQPHFGQPPCQAIMPPSQLQVQNAVKIVQNFKVQKLILLDEQSLEYNQVCEQLLRIASYLDPKLPWIAVILKDELTLRKLVAIILLAQQQKVIISSATPKYDIDLNTVKSMISQAQTVIKLANTDSSVARILHVYGWIRERDVPRS
ncbi:hypothetical protein PUNSTDRAFT_138169 [Punctularia strigosozonata HHB-11173 SS5]|uniref:Uncharacterized protein n=1 Tax=Punctularia strigosozonata (strain HHB-11173) TaxID=741275 RepID=R7S440_PUNST|nr:uncharacterized protein PUNSTDRAFT_138169 [Punctularia strigosozonata HHB-11173 SS5]EIN04983.1 hypothetical protein PUNSTDRAFT_138169 [Punctularia strigosozonata HHB-11173 SS5]